MEQAFLFVGNLPERTVTHPALPSPAGRTRKSIPDASRKPPTTMHNGRRFINDDTTYCLPIDVKELSRQALWHELSREVYGCVSIYPFTPETVPNKVLEICCGSALWSASMADEFTAMGRSNVEFTGLDIEPLYSDMRGVNFKFIQHDVAVLPLPFADNTFDFVFVRDATLCLPLHNMYSGIMGDVLRILRPGGVFEFQCSDFPIRTIQRAPIPYIPDSGIYDVGAIQFSSKSENHFIQQWNERITKALLSRSLPPMPCTLVGPILVMENLVGIVSIRRAVPLEAIWWESNPDSASDNSMSARRRSIGTSSVESFASSTVPARQRGGVSNSASTHHSQRYSNRGSSTSGGSSNYPSPLTEEEKAVRYLAKLTFVQLIESMEHAIRTANNIDLGEWDNWYRELMWNWFEGRGLTGGECLEMGAWYGIKGD